MSSENDDSKDLSKADMSGFSPFHSLQQNWSQQQCFYEAMALLLGKLVLMRVTSGKNSNIANCSPALFHWGSKAKPQNTVATKGEMA